MSIATLSFQAVDQTVVRKRRLGRGVWAGADQILISATNFVTMMLAGRALTKDDFGAFTLIYSALLFANMIQAGLVTQPHNVLGTSRHGRGDYARYTSAIGVGQLYLAVIGTVISLFIWVIALIAGWAAAPLLLALAASIFAWQVQEFCRRVLYTEGKVDGAFWNDIISYGGQTAIIALLYWYGRLNGTLALYALAATSMLAALVGVWQLRHSLTWDFLPGAMRENWTFGKWLAGAELLGWLSSIHMYLYVAAVILGTAAAGDLRAAQILFGPMRVLSFALGTVLPIYFAKQLAGDIHKSINKELSKVFAVVIPVAGGYCMLMALFALPILRVVLPKYSSDAKILILYSMCAFLSYMQMVIAAALTAKHKTRAVFVGNLLGGVVALTISLPLIKLIGLPGAVIAMITGTLIQVLYSFAVYGKRTTETPASEEHNSREADSHDAPPPSEAAGRLLKNVFTTLDETQTPYCVMHGYQGYPETVSGDVDCLMPRNVLPKQLAHTIHDNRTKVGGEIVQWLNDGAQLVVLRTNERDGTPAFLQMHVSSDYEMTPHRRFYRGQQILDERKRHGSFWIPKASMEFGCILANRISKASFKDRHLQQLQALFKQDPAGCTQEIGRFFSGPSSYVIRNAAETGNWVGVMENIRFLRDELLRSSFKQSPLATVRLFIGAWARRAMRWIKPPCGLHVVFLGPDGVGKSTVIDLVRERLKGAFLRTDYHTFAPSLLPLHMQQKPSPHALPPRSFAASMLKVGWWFCCYTAGYFATIHPARARSSLVLGHRYLLDAMVDPKRYRYSGPIWMLKAIWAVAPRPDLVIALDADPLVIWNRKKEVSLEETTRQRNGYVSLVRDLENGVIVDSSQSIDKTVADVTEAILGVMRARAEQQLGLERLS